MEKIIYVDVDDTLIRSVGNKRIPMIEVVRKVRQMYENGNLLYCWSSSGAEYARTSAVELEIEDCFSGFLPKPQIMIDDQTPAEWRYLTVIHPNEIHTRPL